MLIFLTSKLEVRLLGGHCAVMNGFPSHPRSNNSTSLILGCTLPIQQKQPLRTYLGIVLFCKQISLNRDYIECLAIFTYTPLFVRNKSYPALFDKGERSEREREECICRTVIQNISTYICACTCVAQPSLKIFSAICCMQMTAICEATHDCKLSRQYLQSCNYYNFTIIGFQHCQKDNFGSSR